MVEVTSQQFRADFGKKEVYGRIGVKEYIILHQAGSVVNQYAFLNGT